MEVLLVGNTGIQRVVVLRFERQIVEVHQNDDSLLVAKIRAEASDSVLLQVLDATGIDIGALLTGSCLDGFGIDFRKAVGIINLVVGMSIVCREGT